MIVDKPFTILEKIVTLLVVLVTFACGGDDQVLDTTAPEITIEGDNPQTITLPAEYTELGATALDDTDGDISDSIVIANDVDVDVPGDYEVTYSVSDAAGNSTSSTREVIVEDTTAPIITIVGDNPLTITQPNEYDEPGATASDNTDGDISSLIVITGEVNVNVVGTYQVTYSVSDAAGNATSSTRDVIILAEPEEPDTTAPAITILGDNPLTITLPAEYTELGATALDDTDGDISGQIEITTTADFLVPGTYQVTYSVSDAAGNSTSVTRDVIILAGPDTTAPVITISGDNPLTITLPAEYTELGATALDDTDGDISGQIEITTTADFLVPGTYQVTYSVSDAAGNATSNTRDVKILPEPSEIGDFRDGGVVFWVDPTDNTHGLVCTI